jgi:hypothetical protein
MEAREELDIRSHVLEGLSGLVGSDPYCHFAVEASQEIE